MKILICVDHNKQSAETITLGSQLAEVLSAEVTLLHVQQPGREIAPTEEQLARLRLSIPDDAVSFRVRQGTAVDEIFAECQDGQYDMIIVGSPTVAGFLGHIFPSVAQTVAQKAPVSVIVAKREIARLRRLLVCSSGQLVNQPVITAAAELAAAFQAEVALLHVTEPVPQMYTGLNTMAETFAELLESDTPIAQQLRWGLEKLHAADIRTQTILRRGLVIEEIVAESAANDYDMIVLGAPQQQSLWQSLFLGKVAPRVVEEAACAVMVVRS